MVAETKPVVSVKDWCFMPAYPDGEYLMGFPTSPHPSELVTGRNVIRTTRIIRKDMDNLEVETQNTIYKLVSPPGAST